MSIYNGQVTLTQGTWTNLGQGPMQIEAINRSGSANIVVSDTQPPANALGEILHPDVETKLNISIASTVWGMMLPSPSPSMVIDVLSGGSSSSALPANAAQETGGNLAAIAASQGSPGTGITQPTGGAGVLGWLSGRFSKLTAIAVSVAALFSAGQDITTSGNISTQNLNASGAGTAGSFVGFTGLSGRGTITFQVTGGYTGVLTPQVCQDGSNWISFGPTGLENVASGAYSANVTSGQTGIFTANISGCSAFRLVALAAVTGTAVVTMQANQMAQMVSLDNPLPPGANIIGALTANQTVSVNQILGGTPSVLTAATAKNLLGVATPGVAGIVDKASAAITTSGNSGLIADDFGQSCSALINVSAASGTTPTLDLTLQESYDNGTTFQDIYHVERLTAIGTAVVPYIPVGGRRQWKWTLGGTSPSFTVTITAMRGAASPVFVRRFFDRALAATQALNANPYSGTASANSTTGVYNIEGCKSVTMCISSGSATTATAIQMQFSADGAQWFNATAAPTTSVANQNVAIPSIAGVQAKFVRGGVSTAGSAQTLNYVSFTGTN